MTSNQSKDSLASSVEQRMTRDIWRLLTISISDQW